MKKDQALKPHTPPPVHFVQECQTVPWNRACACSLQRLLTGRHLPRAPGCPVLPSVWQPPALLSCRGSRAVLPGTPCAPAAPAIGSRKPYRYSASVGRQADNFGHMHSCTGEPRSRQPASSQQAAQGCAAHLLPQRLVAAQTEGQHTASSCPLRLRQEMPVQVKDAAAHLVASQVALPVRSELGSGR